MIRKIPAKAATMVADEYESQHRMDTGEKSVSFSHEDEILEIESRESIVRKQNLKNKIQTRLGINGRSAQPTPSPSAQNNVLLTKSRKIIKLKPNVGSPNKIISHKPDLKFKSSVKNRLSLKRSLKSPEINNLVTKVNHVSISSRLGSGAGKKILASSSSVFDRLGYNKKK